MDAEAVARRIEEHRIKKNKGVEKGWNSIDGAGSYIKVKLSKDDRKSKQTKRYGFGNDSESEEE